MNKSRGRSRVLQCMGAALAASLVATGAGVVIHTGQAAAQAGGFFLRGVGTTAIKPTSASSINSFGLVCGPAGTAGGGDCAPKASAVMTVDAATKRKLNLTSSTVATGVSKTAGEGVVVRMVASAAVRKRLKTVKTVKVTIVVTATSPMSETFEETVVLTRTGTPKRLLIRSSGDTYDFGGGGRG